MKMKNGTSIIECDPFHKIIWERNGYVEFDEKTEEVTYTDMKRIAKENGINSQGMKKEELLEAIKEYL